MTFPMVCSSRSADPSRLSEDGSDATNDDEAEGGGPVIMVWSRRRASFITGLCTCSTMYRRCRSELSRRCRSFMEYSSAVNPVADTAAAREDAG